MQNQSGKVYLQTEHLSKSFTVKTGEVQVLKDINLTIREGELVIIFGPSGCGKSTLLHTLLGLEFPTSGTVTVDSKDYYSMSEDERAMYRRHHYGIIYQQPLWISSLTVRGNIGFILELTNYDTQIMDQKIMSVLTQVGMQDWADYRPMELSSGQQQKISLARALTLDPILVVADEPTGNLDTVSGQELMDTFTKLNDSGRTIIMVTHDLEYLKFGTHLIHMIDGQIINEVYQTRGESKLAGIKGKRGSSSSAIDANVRDPKFLQQSH